MSIIPSLEDISFSEIQNCSNVSGYAKGCADIDKSVSNKLRDLDKEQYNAYCDYIECRDPAKKDKLLQALTDATNKLEIYRERNNLNK
jgi:hypothetical protein